MGEVVGCALADRLEGNVAINPPERTFGEPHRRGERGSELLKDRSAKQVRHQGDQSSNPTPARRVERNLVHVLDQHVERRRHVAKCPVKVSFGKKRERVSRADSMYLDSVEPRMRWATRPPATEQRDLVPSRREPAKDLVHVN